MTTTPTGTATADPTYDLDRIDEDQRAATGAYTRPLTQRCSLCLNTIGPGTGRPLRRDRHNPGLYLCAEVEACADRLAYASDPDVWDDEGDAA